jgi:RHS repeat-associated protein
VRDGVETRYIYDAAGNLLAEANSSNVIQKYYIHGLGLMAMVTPTGEVYTYHFNAVGSTIAMSDSSQNMVNKYAYDPFGNISANSVENVPQPFKFVGQYGVMTEPNGFYYMRARYYDPEVGRFISEDPSGFDGGINLFIYALNNPITLYDPNGLDPRGWPNPYDPRYSPPLDNPVLRCHVATHNDPVANLKAVAGIAAISFAPIAIPAAVTGGIAAVRAAITVAITNPQAVQNAAEFAEGLFTPGPPSSPSLWNYIGSGAGYAYDYLNKYTSNTVGSSSTSGGK